jgi:hypothetical protein
MWHPDYLVAPKHSTFKEPISQTVHGTKNSLVQNALKSEKSQGLLIKARAPGFLEQYHQYDIWQFGNFQSSSNLKIDHRTRVDQQDCPISNPRLTAHREH